MRLSFILILTILIAGFITVSATIINVPDDYGTIQEGIDASTNGDTVLVQPGTYVENVNFNGHNIVLGSLFLTTGDTSYISQTVIDGNSSGKVVIFESNENSNAIITGFTIQNGYSEYGGGIFCSDSNPVINNNTISGNSVAVDGGGIFCINNSAPMISNNMISGNYTACCGGGICCWLNSNPVICYNVIINNSVNNNGGGISLLSSSPIVSNNTIIGNSSSYGGGISNVQSNPTIINTILREDSASREGHEIYTANSSPSITYCDIQDGWEGEGNIDIGPLFRDPDNDDFHLMAIECGDSVDSPCIDAGHPDILDSLLDCSWGLGTLLSDMGAYSGGDIAVDIDEPIISIPKMASLSQNYPNPFNASTVIRYNLPKPSVVTIDIYDILGRKVQTLIDEPQPAGYHQTIWQANGFSSGVYFYKLQAGDYNKTRKMLMLK